MLLPRLQGPSRAVASSIARFSSPRTGFTISLDASRACVASKLSPTLTFVRQATHKAQRAVNKGKDGPGKRLGAKKSGGRLPVFLQIHNMSPFPISLTKIAVDRTICYSRQHHISSTWNALVS